MSRTRGTVSKSALFLGVLEKYAKKISTHRPHSIVIVVAAALILLRFVNRERNGIRITIEIGNGDAGQAQLHPSHAPEEETEEDQSARVHAKCVANLVSPARVVRGVNRNVVSKNQIRHRDGHQCALHYPANEARWFVPFLKRSLGVIEHPANRKSQRDQKCQPAQHHQHPHCPRAFRLSRFVIHRKQRIMLRERATEPEYFDSPARTPEEIAAGYRELARANGLFFLHDPYTRLMWRWLGAEQCRQLSILDVGAGDGWLGSQMETFGARLGWVWRVTNVELNPVPLQLSTGRHNVAGSALALPFADNSFDVVIASQMTHHLASDAEAVQHFREAWRVAQQGIFITDMTRSTFLYAVIWLAVRALRLTPKMRADGLLSVKRSWTRDEIAALCARAGINATVKPYFGSRWILAARKPAAIACASETSAAYRATGEFCSAPRGR